MYLDLFLVPHHFYFSRNLKRKLHLLSPNFHPLPKIKNKKNKIITQIHSLTDEELQTLTKKGKERKGHNADSMYTYVGGGERIIRGQMTCFLENISTSAKIKSIWA